MKLDNMNVRLAGWLGKANCFPQCLPSRAGAGKADSVDDRGKGIGGAVLAWAKRIGLV